MARKSVVWTFVSVVAFFMLDGPRYYQRIVHNDWFQFAVLVALVWAIWFYFRSRRQEKNYAHQIANAIREVSGVNDIGCIDVCRNTAVALNYLDRAVYVINDGEIKKLTFAKDILGFEFVPANSSGNQRFSDVMVGTQLTSNLNRSEAMDMATGGAMANAAVFSVIGQALAKMPQQGVLKFNLHDPRIPCVWAYVGQHSFVERVQHFFDYCNSDR